MLEQARQFVALDYRIHPLRPGTKKPCLEEWPGMEVSDKDVAHFWGNNNIGLICDGVVVVDFDTGLERAREWYRKHRGILKTITLTRRGIHAWFRVTGQEWHGKHAEGELRCDGKGYVVVPDSVVSYPDGESWQYRFVDGHPLVRKEELPPFRAEYVKRSRRETLSRRARFGTLCAG